MVAKLGFFAVLFAAIGGLAAMGWRLVDRPTAAWAMCPAGHGDHGARAAIAAYNTIQAELTCGSLRNLNRQAALLADFFEPLNPEIAGSARRLAALRDLAAARAEFARLSRLFVPSSAQPAATPPRV